MHTGKLFAFLFAIFFFILACTPAERDLSETQTSREGRAALGAAEGISSDFLETLNEDEILSDWSLQNLAAKDLWSDLNRPTENNFARWQTWYSKEDVQRIFRIAYQNIGPEARAARRAFTASELSEAFAYHDKTQFAESTWNKESFARWMQKYEGKENAIPGLNRILMNKLAVWTLLENYKSLADCYREQSQSLPCPGPRVVFPKGAAFIKTAWRRAQIEGDFELPYFQTSKLLDQLAHAEWQESSAGIPLTADAQRMETPTHQVFHLVGVHVTLKLEQKWFWTSHWLDENSLAAEYKSCSTLGHSPLARSDRSAEEAQISLAEALTGHSWCSNPYLETGLQNHKTNCIGCHQHAGSPWTEEVFADRLQNDLYQLLSDQLVRSRSDQVWSLLNGPEPLVSSFSEEIDYFDVYDI